MRAYYSLSSMLEMDDLLLATFEELGGYLLTTVLLFMSFYACSVVDYC